MDLLKDMQLIHILDYIIQLIKIEFVLLLI